MAESTQKPQGSRPPQGGGQRRGPAPRGGAGQGRPGGSRPGGRGPRQQIERPKPEFEQKTIDIRRVTRVVAGGRRFSFSVVIAIGDRNGSVGVGMGKATDTSLAMQKAYTDARKKMLKLRLSDQKKIPHEVKAKYNSGRIWLMPNTGRGVVVGSSMRSIVELAGIHDITGRVLSGTKNKLNIARATMKALAPFGSPRA